jgi:hypothetical protein
MAYLLYYVLISALFSIFFYLSGISLSICTYPSKSVKRANVCGLGTSAAGFDGIKIRNISAYIVDTVGASAVREFLRWTINKTVVWRLQSPS